MKNTICNFAFDLLSVNCLQELSEEIEDYTQRFNTEDQLEWNLVLQEVAAFVEVMTLSLKCNLKCKSVSFLKLPIMPVTNYKIDNSVDLKLSTLTGCFMRCTLLVVSWINLPSELS